MFLGPSVVLEDAVLFSLDNGDRDHMEHCQNSVHLECTTSHSPRLIVRFSLEILDELTDLLRKIDSLAEGIPPLQSIL